jgi:hypothetical protein
MDQATTLVTELQQKLEQLDQKVAAYRREMTSEFEKHAEALLRDVPEDVSARVNEAIVTSMRAYPSLQMGVQAADPSPETKHDDIVQGSNKPSAAPTGLALPSMPPLDLEASMDSPRSPHEREKEFQGLFTPSYLPLLDSTDRNERRASLESRMPDTSEPRPVGATSRSKSDDLMLSTLSSFDESTRPKPPLPRRRNTDEISIRSEHSDGQPRRSALRRTSSNGSKPAQSPRRVRFEFAGHEYPTTSSPMPETPPLEEIPPLPITSPGDSDDEAQSEQVEYIEDREESPPPKRISSSQALRALSRGPIEDDGTQWTEVQAPPDGSASVEKTTVDSDDSDDGFLGMPSRNGKGKGVVKTNGKSAQGSQNGHTATSYSKAQLKSPPPGRIEESSNGDAELSDEATDVLSEMAPLTTMKTSSSKAYSTTLSPHEVSNKIQPLAKSQTASTTPNTNDKFGVLTVENQDSGKLKILSREEDEDDDLFDFDESPDRPVTKHVGEVEDDEEVGSDGPESPIEDPNLSRYATSPARAIMRPGQRNTSTSTKPESHRQSLGTVTNVPSSYRTSHPFATPIVSDDIHAQAASLGNINTFVGSIHGNTGLDESDVLSHRTTSNGPGRTGVMGSTGGMDGFSGSLAGGQPRSFSERMALEEYMDRRRETDQSSS